jgi:hypothetical protein
MCPRNDSRSFQEPLVILGRIESSHMTDYEVGTTNSQFFAQRVTQP